MLTTGNRARCDGHFRSVRPAVRAGPIARLHSNYDRLRRGRECKVLRDGFGREITLRGFNVSGSTKLAESGFLPFRSTTDASVSAQAMRDLTGANVIRFLINWEGAEPAAAPVDTAYLARAAAQIQEFTDRGFYVLIDYHQDLYSQHLFNTNSWYTGDGAPAWVITAGSYPAESCGICLLWGQNMLTNAAVRDAMHDFWHNRAIVTSAGTTGVQDASISQATQVMTYLRKTLPAAAFQNVIGVDPFNEPFDGGLDGGSGTTWEQTYLMPFYRAIPGRHGHRRMDGQAGLRRAAGVLEPICELAGGLRPSAPWVPDMFSTATIMTARE